MSKTASVLDTGTSGSTPVGYHDLPWPSAASGTPGLLEPASAGIAGRKPGISASSHHDSNWQPSSGKAPGDSFARREAEPSERVGSSRNV